MATNRSEVLAGLADGGVRLLVTSRFAEPDRELVDHICARFPSVPVILLVEPGEADRSWFEQRFPDVSDFVTKPWDGPDLLAKIDRLVGSAQQASEVSVYIRLAGMSLSQLQRAVRVRGQFPRPVPLGEVLVQLGTISDAQYDDLLVDHMDLIDLLLEDGALGLESAEIVRRRRYRHPDRSDYRILVEEGPVGEDAYLRALGARHDFDFVQPCVDDVDPGLLTPFSFRYLRRHHALPLRRQRDHTVVALARPLDTVTVAELERSLRTPLIVCAATREQIGEVLDALVARTGSSE